LEDCSSSQAWPAPAKLNLFLHITGQRDNGYHELQTVFQIIDYCDYLNFEVNASSSEIHFSCTNTQLESSDNLCVQAALALQHYVRSKRDNKSEPVFIGANIHLDKNIPIGAGLGGGSSDAATCLLALNNLWKLNLTRKVLLEIGAKLGADVPVFILGQNAWAEGIGDDLKKIELDPTWYLLLYPGVHVSSQEIYSSRQLTRDQRPITIADFLAGRTSNVMATLVLSNYPVVNKAMDYLSQFGEAKMSGSGSSLFLAFNSEKQARESSFEVSAKLPKEWSVFVVQGLACSPLLERLASAQIS